MRNRIPKTKESLREIKRPRTCLRTLFSEPPLIEILKEGHAASPGWIDVGDTTKLLGAAKDHILRRLDKITESPLARLQETFVEDMFQKLEVVANHKGPSTQLGFALFQLLERINNLLTFTCIAVSDEEFTFHISIMEQAAREGAISVKRGDWKQTFVAARGRRPSQEINDLYEQFDNIKQTSLASGKELTEREAVEAFEKQSGRRLPFSRRERLIVSYQTKKRREAKRPKNK